MPEGDERDQMVVADAPGIVGWHQSLPRKILYHPSQQVDGLCRHFLRVVPPMFCVFVAAVGGDRGGGAGHGSCLLKYMA